MLSFTNETQNTVNMIFFPEDEHPFVTLFLFKECMAVMVGLPMTVCEHYECKTIFHLYRGVSFIGRTSRIIMQL